MPGADLNNEVLFKKINEFVSRKKFLHFKNWAAKNIYHY